MDEEQGPIALDVQQQFRSLDPATRELFYGSGIPGTKSYRPGFLQQAFQASNRAFFDVEGNPIVAAQQVAGLSPDQQRAINLSRQATGIQTPFIERAGGAYRAGLRDLFRGTDVAKGLGREALGAVAGGVGQAQGFREQGLESLFGGLGEASDIARGAEREFGRGLGEASDFLRRGGTGRFDPSMTQQFYDPYEQAVVEQTRKDIMEAGAKEDIAARASDIGRGGESAFGSRARLGATERQEALGRGLGEALSGIRSRGFQQAQQAAMGEFGRQQQALTGLGGSLARCSRTKSSRHERTWFYSCRLRSSRTTGIITSRTTSFSRSTSTCRSIWTTWWYRSPDSTTKTTSTVWSRFCYARTRNTSTASCTG